MFVQQLYRHSKWLFVVVIAFITAQLFINFKRGMVVTPFYHYGMYSEVMRPKTSYEVFEVWVNGRQLQGRDFTPWQWDRIMLPIVYYSSIPQSNRMFVEDIERLMARLHLPADDQRFLSDCNYGEFEHWYKIYLGKLIELPINSIDVRLHTYRLAAGTLRPIQTMQNLSNLCR